MVISKVIGNAVVTDNQKTQEKLDHVIIDNEKVLLSFKVVRDRIIFTNRRILLVDYKGVTGRKTEYVSIPYKSIVYFSIETAGLGVADLDFELKIWMRGSADPITRDFKKNRDLAFQMKKILTEYTV